MRIIFLCLALISFSGCGEKAAKAGVEKKKLPRAMACGAPAKLEKDTIVSTRPEAKTEFVVRKYTNLSGKFNFQAKCKTIAYGETARECIEWTYFRILDKKDSLLQEFKRIPAWDFYSDLSDVRSFETHFREKAVVRDEYMGMIVVGDFNLDSLSDIALIANVPMSGTPGYNFYLQQRNGGFKEDAFFSKQVSYIPERPDYSKRKFRTHSHYGCCMHVWKYFSQDSTLTWKKVKTVEKDARDE